MARGRADSEREALEAALEIAQRALRFIEAKSLEEFGSDEVLRLAVERLLQMYGEALTDVSREMLAAVDSTIDWRGPIGFRNLSAHWYVEQLDHELIWETLTAELPREIAAISAYLTRMRDP